MEMHEDTNHQQCHEPGVALGNLKGHFVDLVLMR